MITANVTCFREYLSFYRISGSLTFRWENMYHQHRARLIDKAY